jgi:hypothetical protein
MAETKWDLEESPLMKGFTLGEREETLTVKKKFLGIQF